MRKIGLSVLGLAFALSFGWAQTDSTSTDTSMTGGMMGDFTSFDADGDGLISADELGQGLLTQFDTNADGSLDETEFAAISAGGTSSASGDTSTDTSTDTASGDTSTDTSTDTASGDTSTDTTATDTTSDASLATTTETLPDFASLDTDASGSLSASELGQGLVTMFDTAGDGLDETEFASVSTLVGGTVNTQ